MTCRSVKYITINIWIFAFAYRFASDYRKLARHRHERSGDEVDVPDSSESVDDRIDAGRSRALVLEALDSLDLEKRAVFVMHEIAAHSMPKAKPASISRPVDMPTASTPQVRNARISAGVS